jgi:hypothetical protein
MAMKNLNEGPSKGHLQLKLHKRRYWMQDIGGQLCTKM